MTYEIFYSKGYVKDIKKIPNKIEDKAKKILHELLKKPTKLPRNTKPLISQHKDIFRTRIGKYRIIYNIDHNQKTIYVIAFKVRSKIYRPWITWGIIALCQSLERKKEANLEKDQKN